MPTLLKRWLRRLAILAFVLGVLALVIFTWLCYWPLEGSQESVEGLVPATADFLVKTSWRDLRDTGFLQKNLRDEPLTPGLRQAWSQQVQPLLEQLADVEAQINRQIPLGLATFSVEDDLFPGEVVAAGRWCRERPPPAPPSWREVLLLWRTGWKAKAAVAALKHGFIRDIPKEGGANVLETDEEGIYKIVLARVRPSPPRVREGCGDGFVMPPENEWYLARIKDVIALSNSPNLIAKAVDLGRSGGDGFMSRPGVSLEAPGGSVAAAMDLRPLHIYLRRLVDTAGDRTRALKYFLGLDALDRMVGHLSLASPDLLAGRASIRLDPGALMERVQENYRSPPLDLQEGLPAYLPAADTFALVQIRTDPFHLLTAVHEGLMTDLEREVWRKNLLEKGTYLSVEAFLRDLAQHLSDSVAISLGRLSDLYDVARFDDQDLEDPERPRDPMGALAFVVPLRQGARQTDVDEFLAARVHLMGFSPELERVEYRGFTYTRLKFERFQDAADLKLVRPAYLLVQDRLVFANHEDYFKKVLDTLAAPETSPPLSRDPTFQVTQAALPRYGHFSVWLDLERLTRVPAPSPDRTQEPDPAGGPRGLLWDRRGKWVADEREWRQRAIELRRQLHARYGSVPLTLQQDEQVEREISVAREAWFQRYGEFLEDYRVELLGLRRVRALGLVLAAQGVERLQAETVLVFRGAEPLPAR